LKKALRKAQQSKKGKKQDNITQAHQAYLDQAQLYLNTLSQTLKKLDDFSRCSIQPYIDHGARQFQQIYSRVIEHKTIESSKKVYSIFEPDTEWVNKGKAGNKIELGIKVSIMEDQHQFILNHRVMRQAAKLSERSKPIILRVYFLVFRAILDILLHKYAYIRNNFIITDKLVEQHC